MTRTSAPKVLTASATGGQPRPPGGLLRVLLHLPVYLYRARLGLLLGNRFLLLVHRGRRTGRRYETVLEVVSYDHATSESVVVAGWGRRTQWLHNLEAGGTREVATAGRRYAPLARRLDDDEAAAVLAAYERRNRLITPVVRAVLSRLVGSPYDGSPAARRRLVRQLPMLGFRPRPRPARQSDPQRSVEDEFMKFASTVVIRRNPAEVFGFLADPENIPKWNYAIAYTRLLTRGPVRVGTRFRQTRTVPRLAEEELEVTDVVPNRRLVLRGDLGRLHGSLAYQLEEVPDGTRLTNLADLTAAGPVGIVAELAGGRVQAAVADNLESLKRILERRDG